MAPCDAVSRTGGRASINFILIDSSTAFSRPRIQEWGWVFRCRDRLSRRTAVAYTRTMSLRSAGLDLLSYFPADQGGGGISQGHIAIQVDLISRSDGFDFGPCRGHRPNGGPTLLGQPARSA